MNDFTKENKTKPNSKEAEQNLLEDENADRGLLEDENADRGLLETQITEEMLLEHPSYKELLEKLTSEEQKSQDNYNKWLLAQADVENIKRRAERDVTSAHKYGIEKFAYEILITVDNLERSLAIKTGENGALKDFYAGIELTLKHLLETLQKFGITQINPGREPFDHEKHTAVTTREDKEAKPNTVLEVIQKGYWLKDRLLRPALVVVSK
jgi:molecular chaperone GrpE